MCQDNNGHKKFYNSCPVCKQQYYYTDEDIWFDDTHLGYSIKLVQCPICKKINIIRYYEDENLDVNNDERYYEYIKKIN